MIEQCKTVPNLMKTLFQGTAILSPNSNEGFDLEISFCTAEGSTGPESILQAIQNVSTIQFGNPVISSYLAVNGRKLLPSSKQLKYVTAVLNNNAVSFFGGSTERRKEEKDKIEKVVSDLFIVDIAFPHEVFKNMVVDVK